MTDTTEQQAVAVASRLTRFRECVDAIPYVAERLTLGQQFNAYDSALNAEDDADEDCTMYVSIGPITNMRSIVTVEGRAEGEMIAHALTFAGLASVSSASAEPFGYWVAQKHAEPALLRKPAYIPEPSDLRTVTPLYTSPEPVPATSQAGEVREGCVGTMDAARATYFLERFKREEKLLGPHEQWALDFTIAALATQPATSHEGEAQQWRHKLWMVACHATGGGIPEIEGIDRSVNDICVQITQARNMIYQAGKDAALAATPTPPTLSEDLREVLEFYADRDGDGYRVDVTNYGLSTEEGEIVRDHGGRARAALARAQVKAS